MRKWASMVILAVALMALAGCSGRADPRQVELVEHLADNGKVVQILHPNTQLVIHTAAIDEIVAEGPRIVPLVVDKMTRGDVPFDTFVRGYSVCQILLHEIYWTGGVRRETVDGEVRFVPYGQGDINLFRQAVVNSINDEYAGYCREHPER